MKYIIDIPDEVKWIQYIKQTRHGTQNLKVKSVCDMTPYTEPDRKQIEDAQEEAWRLASKLIWTFTEPECRDIFHSLAVHVVRDMTYKEAKAKYEAWLQAKRDKESNIEVGDEVVSYDDTKAVVMDFTPSGAKIVFTENGCIERWDKTHRAEKTGRHFDAVEDILKAMNGEE